LIADQFADAIVAQFLSAGADYWRLSIVQSLMEITGIKQVYERSDVDIRQLEGLPLRTGMLQGEFDSDHIMINENGIRFQVDIKSGQKTGFFLDQRANRTLVRKLVKDCDVLDCFCYTGAFTAASLAGGAASVVCVDSSANALAQLRTNLQLNDLNTSKVDALEGDVFRLLREFRDRGKSFDFIILDPPKFAQSVSQVERAARGYKDINLLALKLLRENGMLATFSCSGSVDDVLFQKIVAGAALDAGVKAQIILRLHQDFDHPVALNFPEGAYLKGLLIKVG
jgi:23S rRNA (cytosine1962-C5)-methyltransferase